MAFWTNNTGGTGNWSNNGNWAGGKPPTGGDTVSFFSGTYTSVIDTGFPFVALSQINLRSINLTLDVERSITVGYINGSDTGTASPDGLLEVGNGAAVNYAIAGLDFSNITMFTQFDNVGATGSILFRGKIDSSTTLNMNSVNFDTTVGIIDFGGTVTLQNGATWSASSGEVFNDGQLALSGGGVANLGSLAAENLNYLPTHGLDSQLVAVSGKNNTLTLPNTSDARALEITGLGPTDIIEINGVSTAVSATFSGGTSTTEHGGSTVIAGTLALWSGANGTGTELGSLTDVNFANNVTSYGVGHFNVSIDPVTGNSAVHVVCFARGTHILTDTGEVAVEDLREGDRVVTCSATGTETKPVIWIGRRQIDLTRHPSASLVAPVRIRRGAFADNVPHRDVVLSPDHAIFIDGGLVPAKLLVNGMTITRETPSEVTYFHVECESHAIIMADGLTVETYLDTGNRAWFENAGLALLLHPEFSVNIGLKSWDGACASLWTEATRLEPIRERIAERGRRLGFAEPEPAATSDNANARLLVNGCELRPVIDEARRYVFIVPDGANEATLLSRTIWPAAMRPGDDERRLGLAVREITLYRGTERTVVSADDPCLRHGWWEPEANDARCWRWTCGAGVIPLPFAARVIEVRLAATTRYPIETRSLHQSEAA